MRLGTLVFKWCRSPRHVLVLGVLRVEVLERMFAVMLASSPLRAVTLQLPWVCPIVFMLWVHLLLVVLQVLWIKRAFRVL